MILLLLAAGAAASGGAARFTASYPSASVIVSADGARLTHASSFEAPQPGKSPEAAARSFLSKHRAAFGIGPRQRLVARDRPEPGRPAAVHFERRIDGFPVFDGDIVVGLNAAGAVTLVNGADVPAPVAGRARISRRAAIRAAQAAIPGLETTGVPRASRGWRAAGKSVRPVWRVDFTAGRPRGDWRSYVSAETGKVLLRLDLRSTAPGIAPESQGLDVRPKEG